MKTYAPSSTNRLAVANPTPVEPPVINAVLPFRSAMIMPFASSGLLENGHAWPLLGGLPLSALLFAPHRPPGQVIAPVPGDRRASRVQGSELGGGQRDRQ